MKNNMNNTNKANNCKSKAQSSKANNCRQTEEKNQKTTNYKSSMDNSDY
ncbi:MAG: hypothetical protein ACK5MV_07060 [Aminipila sp.]